MQNVLNWDIRFIHVLYIKFLISENLAAVGFRMIIMLDVIANFRYIIKFFENLLYAI